MLRAVLSHPGGRFHSRSYGRRDDSQAMADTADIEDAAAMRGGDQTKEGDSSHRIVYGP
jgi:ApbE superfamily uncharacterized protein (UPF0280 family)